MAIFVSYSSQDEDVVKELAQGFEAAHREVWFDHDLGGGEVWWVKILENIRKADVFVVAVSDKSQDSKPCKAELDYALALGRSVLPIKVGPVTNFLANPLSTLQMVEFRTDDVRSVFEIMGAVDEAARRAVPLPDVLPPEPPIPYLYLLSFRKQIDAEPLSQAAQLDAVDGLRKAFREETDPTVQDTIVSMLRRLRAKPWATVQTLGEVDGTLSWMEAMRRVASAQSSNQPATPPVNEVRDDEHSHARAEEKADRERREAFGRSIAEAVQQQEVPTKAPTPPADQNPPAQHEGSPSSAPPWNPSPWTSPAPDVTPTPPPPLSAADRFPGVRAARPAGVPGTKPAQPRTTPRVPPSRAGAGTPVPRPQVPATLPPRPTPAPTPTPTPVSTAGTPRPWWGLTIPSLIIVPVGLIALYFSVRVGKLRAQGDVTGARRASTYALVWGVIGVCLLAVVIAQAFGA